MQSKSTGLQSANSVLPNTCSSLIGRRGAATALAALQPMSLCPMLSLRGVVMIRCVFGDYLSDRELLHVRQILAESLTEAS